MGDWEALEDKVEQLEADRDKLAARVEALEQWRREVEDREARTAEGWRRLEEQRKRMLGEDEG